MKDERLQEIREYASELFNPHRLGDVATVELLAYVDQLTGERDRARDSLVPSFVTEEGDESEYTHALNDDCETCGRTLVPFWGGMYCDDCERFAHRPEVVS